MKVSRAILVLVASLPTPASSRLHMNASMAYAQQGSASPGLFVATRLAMRQPALKFDKGRFDVAVTSSFKDSMGHSMPFGKESEEHSQLVKYLQPDSTVFELGSRYGSSSCVIAWIQKNSGRLVSVEGDADVWDAQAQNMQAINCKNTIWRGFVSRKRWKKSKRRNGSEWTTTFEVVENERELGGIPSTSFADLQRATGMKFDTFLVDCEGCFDSWLQEFPDAVDTVSTILLEADYGVGWQRQGYADYERVTNFLTGKGFMLAEQKRVQDSPFAESGRIDFLVFTRVRPYVDGGGARQGSDSPGRASEAEAAR